MEFDKFKFEEKIYEALDLMNFKTPTPVQQKAIPQIINGKDNKEKASILISKLREEGII